MIGACLGGTVCVCTRVFSHKIKCFVLCARVSDSPEESEEEVDSEKDEEASEEEEVDEEGEEGSGEDSSGDEGMEVLLKEGDHSPPPPAGSRPKKEISHIAATAESLQPKGYTLATAKVRGDLAPERSYGWAESIPSLV